MVGAVLQKLRYIKLACGMGDLTVPDKLTVEPDIEAGGNTLKIQKCARGSGIFLVGKVIEVSAAGVFFRNIRWISGERIADVGVLVVVVAVVLPYAGHRDAVKSGGIIAYRVESILQAINAGVVPKLPTAIQKLEAVRSFTVLDQSIAAPGCRNVIGTILHGTHMQCVRVLVIVRNNHPFSSCDLYSSACASSEIIIQFLYTIKHKRYCTKYAQNQWLFVK